MLHDCLHSRVFNSSAVKVDPDSLADLELAFWLLGHYIDSAGGFYFKTKATIPPALIVDERSSRIVRFLLERQQGFLLSEIVFVQPLRSRQDDVGDGMLALAVPDTVHGVIKPLLVQSAQNLEGAVWLRAFNVEDEHRIVDRVRNGSGGRTRSGGSR